MSVLVPILDSYKCAMSRNSKMMMLSVNYSRPMQMYYGVMNNTNGNGSKRHS